jgi:hypothetical protein
MEVYQKYKNKGSQPTGSSAPEAKNKSSGGETIENPNIA